MTSQDKVQSFQQANPGIEILVQSSPGYAQRRETRGQEGQEITPLAIAIPKNAQDVAQIVRWAQSSGVGITVRTGGNDFYGRNAVEGALVIDMREINFVKVAEDKKSATVGGGVIAKDLLYGLDEQSLVAPLGNTWAVGYVGWATLGGYGPLTNELGMGFEGIIGAEIVNDKSEIVQATEEQLEGIRGMGGNLGVVTSLTIKVYPKRDILSGFLIFDAEPETIKQVTAAYAKLEVPRGLTTHFFIMPITPRALGIIWSWTGSDMKEGQQHLETFVSALPPVKMNTVQQKPLTKYYEDLPAHNLPYGGQRSIYIKELSPGIMGVILEALADIPPFVNIGWSMQVDVDQKSAPANCFCPVSHIMLSFNDMVPEEQHLEGARKWTNGLLQKFRDSNDPALMDGGYPPLSRPGDHTTQQQFGEKWLRAKELKDKYDPSGVFKYAVPRF